MPGLIDNTGGLNFNAGLIFQAGIGGAGLLIGEVSLAAMMLANYSDGLAISFAEDMSMVVKDTATPANNYSSQGIVSGGSLVGPGGKLTFTSPSLKNTLQADGYIKYQAHNLFISSESFDSWVQTGCVVSGNVLTASAGGTNHRINRTLALSASYAVFFDVSAGTHSIIQIYDGASTDNYANFNLAAGVVGTKGANTSSSSIEPLGGGVYRCRAEWGANGTANGNTFLALSTSASSTWGATFSATGNETITLHKSHLRRTPSNSDYIATTSAAKYALPYTYDTSGNCLGVLVEEARTNIETYANDFTNAIWGASANISVTPAATTSPDGTSNASRITSTATGTSSYLRQVPYTVSATTQYTTSVFAKKDTVNFLNITVFDGTDGNRIWFNLNTGAVASSAVVGAGLTSVSGSISIEPNGFYRCSVTFTMKAATSLFVFRSNCDSDASLTATTGAALFYWKAQTELGAKQSSVITTYGSTVTRAADNVSMLTSLFPYSATEGALYVKCITSPRTTANASGESAAHLVSTVQIIRGASSLNFGAFVGDATFRASGVTAANTEISAAIAYKSGDNAWAFNGGAVGTGVGTTLTTATQLTIGGPAHFNSVIKSIMYVPQRVSNANLPTFGA